ncbi:MAG: extracellular solute-binding protein [Desulforhopalus sp.]|nr:extracellular solute-binding protein [Desulforhopalus sp.]
MNLRSIRLLLTSLLLLAALPLLAMTTDPPPATITLFHYFSGALSGGLSEMIATVNAGRQDRQVHAQGLDHEAFKSMIHATMARGNPPELFSYWAGAKTQELVDNDKLVPLDDLWLQAELGQRFTTAVTDKATSYNGKRYLLPITQHFVVFFYNAQLFKRYRLSAPATWQELLQLAATLQEKGVTPFALGAKEGWPAQFWFDYLLLRRSGAEYRQRLMAGGASYLNHEVEEAFATLGGLLAKGYFNADANDIDWPDATKMVCTGQAAMTLMGTWAIPALTAADCGLAEEIGFDFFAFPEMDKGVAKVALGPVDGIVVTKVAGEHQFAKSLLGYFAEVEPQTKFSLGSGAFSPNSQVPEDIYSPLKRRIRAEMVSAPEWAFNYDLATKPAIAGKGLDSLSELIAFPDQYLEILRHLQAEVEKLRPVR